MRRTRGIAVSAVLLTLLAAPGWAQTPGTDTRAPGGAVYLHPGAGKLKTPTRVRRW